MWPNINQTAYNSNDSSTGGAVQSTALMGNETGFFYPAVCNSLSLQSILQMETNLKNNCKFVQKLLIY